MKKILFSCLISTICLILLSCTNTNTSYTVTEEPNLFEEWFEKYQEDNPTWTRSIEGHNKLKEAFSNEVKSNIDFAKSLCSGEIFISECISSYERKDGEYGGLWAYVYKKEIKLKNPLYNGQKTVEVAYEIISMIPSTKSHDNPFIDNANYSDTFKPYHSMDYDGTLNLGSFIITRKDNE